MEAAYIRPIQPFVWIIGFCLNGNSLTLLIFSNEIYAKVGTSSIRILIPEPYILEIRSELGRRL